MPSGYWREPTPAEKARLDDLIEMAHQFYTLEEMGAKHGITRERVRQILKKAGVTTSEIKAARDARIKAIPKLCPHGCGEMLTGDQFKGHIVAGKHKFKMYRERRSPEKIAQDAAIAADYDAGMTYDQIMTKYGVKFEGAVTRALRWNGIEPNRNRGRRAKTIAESHARWVAMAADWDADELLDEEILAKYGVTSGVWHLVWRYLGRPSPSRPESWRRRVRVMAKRGLNFKGRPLTRRAAGWKYRVS